MGLMDAIKESSQKTYIKMQGQEMIFQLAELEATETYKVEDTQAIDKQHRWFYKDMELTATDGTTIKVEETKGIKNSVFLQFFPHKKRWYGTNRKIIVEGQGEGVFNFSTTGERALEGLIKSIQAMGNNPLEVLFKLKKVATEGGKTSYVVEVAGKAKPKDAVKTTTQINLSTLTLAKPIVNTPNDTEQQVIKAIKENLPKENWTGEIIMQLCTQEKISMTLERAKELVKYF